MPQIPRGQDINRRTPDLQQRVTVEDTRNAGGVVAALSRGLGGELDRRTKLEVSKAESSFLTQKALHDNAFDDDEDFGTISGRYKEGIDKSLAEAGSQITDPRVREQFNLNVAPRIEEGTQRMGQIARSKEVDYETASLNEGLRGIRDSGVIGNAIDATNAMRDRINASVENNIISATAGDKLFHEQRQDMLIGKLEMLDPADRVQALDEAWAQDLPPDTILRLRRGAKKETDEDTAVILVDQWMDEGITPGEAIERYQDIEDIDVRMEVERRFKNDWDREQSEVSRVRTELYDDLYGQVRGGDLKVQDLTEAQKETLGSGIGGLYEAEKQSATRTVPKTSDIGAYYTMQMMLADPEVDPLVTDEFYRENINKFSMTDAKALAKAVAGDMNPQEKEVLSAMQYINARVRAANPSVASHDGSQRAALESSRSTQIANVQLETNTWVQTQLELTGKTPTNPEIQSHIDGQFIDMIYQQASDTWMPFDEKQEKAATWQALDPTQRGQAIGVLAETQPVVYQQILNVMGTSGENMDPGQFIEAYAYVYGSDVIEPDMLLNDASFAAWNAAQNEKE